MPSMSDFFNLYRHGFARVALATPLVRIGDPACNVAATLALMQRGGAREGDRLAVFPELGLSAYSCEDLFHQQALLGAAEEALRGAARAHAPAAARRAGRPAGGGRRPALQLRRAGLPGAAARRGAEDLPAELPRVLRGPPVHAGRHRAAERDRARRADARRSARICFFGFRNPEARAARRDLRGPVGAGAALLLSPRSPAPR